MKTDADIFIKQYTPIPSDTLRREIHNHGNQTTLLAEGERERDGERERGGERGGGREREMGKERERKVERYGERLCEGTEREKGREREE